MPRIEEDYLPNAGDGLRFLPILSDAPTDRGAQLVLDNSVDTPVILDPEGEMFRRLRVAGMVFPLNVVGDQDAKVVHIDTELEYDEAGAAAMAEL